MSDLELASPWVICYKRIEALFSQDPEVNVVFNDKDIPCVKIYVADSDKALALEQILPSSFTFGNVELFVNIYPPNVEEFDKETLYRKAFDGNNVISFIDNVQDGTMHDGLYVMFNPEVAQYVNDDVRDYYGIESILYQDIAKEIFTKDNDVKFCTDLAM